MARGARATICALAVLVVACPSWAGAAATRSAVASAPRDLRVVAHIAAVELHWRPPASTGGESVTSYVVTSRPVGRGCTTALTACTISRLTAHIRYRFAVAAFTGAGRGATSAWTMPLRTVSIVVVAGQSNATGANSFVVDPETHRSVFDGRYPADRLVRMSFAGPYWHPATLPPRALDYPQVDVSDHGVVTFGPEVGLARGLWARGQHAVVVEKVVANGTTLAVDWRPGGVLWDRLVGRSRALLQWSAAHGLVPTVGGVFWLQGESDALHAADASAYRSNLTRFIAAVRRALPLDARTPFVLGETTIAPWVRWSARHGGCPRASCDRLLRYNAMVRAAQVAVARAAHDVWITDTAGLPRASIQLHLTAAGELDVGSAFAKIAARHLT